ncbi:MAG: DMT family transporter [Alphaproteobacteria bacterium]|nr:DMT family transporter [Alphaproteobacteria bacterium]
MNSPSAAIAISARRNVLGAIHMVIGLFLFGVMEVLIKWQVADYPVHQLVFFRASFGLIPCLVLVWQAGGLSTLKTTRPFEHLLRSLVGLSAMWLVFSAYETMHLADVGAILFAAPLFLTAMAGPVLGETVGARRWSAVMVGFVGVLLILKPGTTALQPAAVGVLGAAFLFAVAMIFMRRLGTTESAATITFYLSVFIVLVSLVLIALFGWVTPTPADFLALAMIGLIGGTAQLFLTQSLRLGEAAVVSPLRYSSIIWAVLFGYLFWGSLPDAMVVTGLVIVISSGLYILHRETRLSLVERRRDLPPQ